MKKEMICIVCPAGCHITVEDGVISGNSCERGYAYAQTEMTAPKRTVTSTVRVDSSRQKMLPVKTDKGIDKALMFDAVDALCTVVVSTPVHVGDVIVPDVCGSGVNFVAAKSLDK